MSQFEKLMSLIELEKEKVEKEIKIAQESEAKKIIVSKVLEDCSDEADLINIDFNLFSSFDDYKKKEMKSTISKARFLFEECAGLDLTNQPQYRGVMSELREIYDFLTLIRDSKSVDKLALEERRDLLQELLASMDKNGFIKYFNNFDLLEEILETIGFSEEGKYTILTGLLKSNLILFKDLEVDYKEELPKEIIKSEPIAKPEPIVQTEPEELKHEDLGEFQIGLEGTLSKVDFSKIFTPNQLEIYYEVKEIIDENIEDIRKTEIRDNGIHGYDNLYKQCGIKDIPIEFAKKVLLKNMYKTIKEIEEALKTLNYTYDDGVVEELQMNIEVLKEYFKEYRDNILALEGKNLDNDSYKELIFLNNVEKEFKANGLKEKVFRHQIISALSELRKGNFRNVSPSYINGIHAYAKKKGGSGGLGGSRVVYTPLANDMILVMHVSSRQANYGDQAKNIYENNKELIGNLISLSKDPNRRREILGYNKDFREEIYSLIDEKNKNISMDGVEK